MRLPLISILTLFFSIALGQSSFIAEGVEHKTACKKIVYSFGFTEGDTIHLFFKDSTISYYNIDSTVKKTNFHFSTKREKDKEASKLEYFTYDLKDSLSLHFIGDSINRMYYHAYDSQRRPLKYGMKKRGVSEFEWHYEYKDSTWENGNVEIETIYNIEDSGNRAFHFRTLYFINREDEIIKSIRESFIGDPDAQVIEYAYDENGYLIGNLVDGEEIKIENGPKCRLELVFDYNFSTFEKLKEDIHNLLTKHHEFIFRDNCRNKKLTLHTSDNSFTISIVRSKPYWCSGRTVSVIKEEKY